MSDETFDIQDNSANIDEPNIDEPNVEDQEQNEPTAEDTDEPELLDMTIEDFLKGATAYEIAENAIKRVLVKRRVYANAMVSQLDEKTLDLCTADIYMWCASTPSAKNDTEDSDGGWKHKEGGWQTSAYDKRQLREMAKDLYDKWGENYVKGSKARIINL